MFRWETWIFHIILRVSILLPIVEPDPLSPTAYICSKLTLGDSPTSEKLSPCLIPYINRVMSKCSMIATLTSLENISTSVFIDAHTVYFSTFEANTSASRILLTSGLPASWIVHQMIHWVNCVTITIQQQNNPDAVVVQMAWFEEKLGGQGNWFNDNLIEGGWVPGNSSWVCREEYCPANLQYAFHFNDRIDTRKANTHGSVIWQMVHHDQLLVENFAVFIMCDSKQLPWNDNVSRYTPKSTTHCRWFFGFSPMYLVLSGGDNQNLLNQYTSWESQNMIY